MIENNIHTLYIHIQVSIQEKSVYEVSGSDLHKSVWDLCKLVMFKDLRWSID